MTEANSDRVTLSFEPVSTENRDSEQDDKDNIQEPTEADITCDYVFCKWNCLQHFRSPKCVVALISLVAYSQIMLSIGFSSSTITTLERRFRLSSSETGIILSLYEVGSILCVVPISYFCTNSRRLRTVSVTVIIMGLGSFIYALPHFLAGYYVYDTPVHPVCYANSTTGYPDFCADKKGDAQLNQYKWVFMLGQFVMGAASPAALTLGIPYLDDSLPANIAPFYLGFCYTSIVLGSASGFVIGGMLMRIYVDVGAEHPGLDPSNTKQWVGAWWIGFVITGVILILTSLPLFGFPKQLPSAYEVQRQRRSEAYGKTESESRRKKMTAADFWGNIKLLMKNATFILLIASTSIDQVKKTGFTSFGVKYYEANFKVSSTSASLLFGILLVVAGGSGIFLGGVIVRVCGLRMRGLLRFIVLINIISIPMEFILFIPCGPGTTKAENSGSSGLQHLITDCNRGCQCTMDAVMFEPSCGSNGLTYYSPCYAGCNSSLGHKKYGDCSCIPPKLNFTGPEVRRGECTENCPYLKLFFALSFINAFIHTLAMTPYVTAVLRCVPTTLKPTALGINTIMSKIMGSIPGPLLVGGIMDSACSLWTKRCGVHGNCAHYSLQRMRFNLFSVNMIVTIISLVLLIASMLIYRTAEEKDKRKKKKEGIVDDGADRENKSMPLLMERRASVTKV